MSNNANWFNRLALFLAGVLGAGGVAAAAGASHADDDRILGALSLIGLSHAAVFVAFGLSSITAPLLRSGALIVGIGVCLFSADLSARYFFGQALFPMSAPFGGGTIIVGWLVIAIAGLAGRR